MVHKHTGLLNEFTHILGRDASNHIPHHHLIAAILALGTNHGIRKMALCLTSFECQLLERVKKSYLKNS